MTRRRYLCMHAATPQKAAEIEFSEKAAQLVAL
jgi:hypothetical protein